MLLDDAYRLLDLTPRASDEDVKGAHRDLMKVWHPDRFGHDSSLRQKAEEKLKTINDAYDTIQAARESGWRPTAEVRDEAPAGDPASRRRDARQGHGTWAITCALLAVYFLFRRPTPVGLAIAVMLLVIAAILMLRRSRP